MTRWMMTTMVGVFVLAVQTLEGGRARAADSADRPDAQMLLDLDLLRQPDLAKSRDFYRRMNVVERMRLLEVLPVLESDAQPVSGQPVSPPRRPDIGGK